MATNLHGSDDESRQIKAKATPDEAVRDQFPVIVDFDRRIEKVEKRYHRLRDLTILSIAAGLGIAFGSLAQNYGQPLDWGWPAAITCGVTIVATTIILRVLFK